jgi:conjugal transfer ATP-binding protein TraC
MQFLLKQSPTAVDVLSDVFKLTSEEKKRLSQFPVGQGLFFAGQNHVHIQVIASPTEAGLISTTPTPVEQQTEVDLQPPQPQQLNDQTQQPYGAEETNTT